MGGPKGKNLQLQNTRLKLLKKNSAIWFNQICKTKQLAPKYFNIKINGNKRKKDGIIYLTAIG